MTMKRNGYVVDREGSRMDWCTPRVVISLVHEFFGGAPDLDPCGSAVSIVKARRQYLIERGENGLILPWSGSIYVNPPFDLNGRFMRKASHSAGPGTEIIFLLPARTDTNYWHRWVPTCAAICFWKGRMTFLGASSTCPFSVSLLYWGDDPEGFHSVFSKVGMVINP